MGIIAKDKGGADIAPCPTGNHHSICYGVVDIGTQPQQGQYPARRKIIILFEFPDHRIDLPDKEDPDKKLNLPRGLSIKETLSLSSKGNLRPILEGWRGKPFTEEQLKGFDLKNLIGANALCNVVHTRKDEKTYADIATVSPLVQGMKKRTAENPPLYFSFEDIPDGQKIEIPPRMPQWITGMIMQSDEYIMKSQQADHPPRNDSQGTRPTVDEDEDVPF